MNYSPLFWPIQLKGNAIYILDETELPNEVRYIKSENYHDSCRAIKEMKTRAVGQVLLVMYTFLLELQKDNSFEYLSKVAEEINSTRPTLSFKMLTDMVLGWVKQGAPLDKSILGFLEGLKAMRIRQAQEVTSLINDKDVILTHCNISGLMPLIGELCREQNKEVSFYATETRPYLQGSRLTAWELHETGFNVTVISDNMVAQIMHEGKVSKVIVGADHLALNGDIANKIGTYQIAILAKHFNIPFYVICPPPSKAAAGKEIKIEVRPQDELLIFNNIRIAKEGTKAYYPAFDVTPNELITKHIYLGTVLK